MEMWVVAAAMEAVEATVLVATVLVAMAVEGMVMKAAAVGATVGGRFQSDPWRAALNCPRKR
jgi:hypothetical protein